MMEDELEVDYDEDQPGESSTPADDGGLAEEVYGDLFDDKGEKGPLLQAKHAALQEECQELRRTVARLEAEAQALAVEREAWQEERRILVRNISCIFRTAKEELERKDAALQERDSLLEESRQKLDARERAIGSLKAVLGAQQGTPVQQHTPPIPDMLPGGL